MKDTNGRVLAVARLAAMALLAAPTILAAQGRFKNGEIMQRGYPATNPDAPKILIGAMMSATKDLGVKAGDELRNRVRDEHNANDLSVIPGFSINTTLEQSGYRTDSAISRADLIELSRQLQATEAVLGSIMKLGGDSVRWETTMLIRSGQVTVPQPLQTVTARNLGDAAKNIEQQISTAQKQLPGYTGCHNSVLANKFDEAVKSARAAVAAYPQSTVARLCMLQAMQKMNAPADSLVANANAILTIDPTNSGAMAILADAYTSKGDTTKAIETEVKLYQADKSNQTLAQAIVQQLAASGAPEKAIPIINDILKDNPGDPAMMKVRWLLYLRAKDWKDAYTAGEEYIAADTSAANEDFFTRMAAAASADSNAAKQAEYLGRAVKKFPKNAELELNYANVLFKAGQLQQAIAPTEAALALDPKSANGYTLLLVLFTQTNRMYSAMVTARKAIAAGASKQTIGDALAAFIAPAAKKAQASKDRGDWMDVYRLASTVDSIAPTPITKFYIGVSTFTVGLDAFQHAGELQTSKKAADKATACAELKLASDMWANAQIAMPAGGSVDKNVAGQILGSINQYGDDIEKGKKALCK